MSDRSYEQFQKIESAVEVQIQDSVFVNGDYARLEQVMDNLISNAIKYAPGSPFKISLSADHARAVIKVEDRGPGIAKEKQDKIFNRYERASESKNISGLGLGLFIVSEIIKAHEGTISLDSESGKSTVFCIELPIERKGESSFG
jgi:signal transduction histidine kinase